MKRLIRPLVAVGLLAWAAGFAQADGEKKRKPNFTVSKETTYVTGPLDKEGYVDYAAALNERLGKGVTPDTNANVLIWKALGPRPDGARRMPAEFFKLMGMEEPPEQGDYYIDLRRFLRDHLKIEDSEAVKSIDGQLSLAARYPWTAKDHPQLAEWLKANEKPLAQIVEATKRKRYFAPIEPSSDLLGARQPPLNPLRQVASALSCRAMLSSADGRINDAWQDLLACHRLGRLISQGGMLIEGLVGIRIDDIACQADLAILDRPELDSKRLLGYLADLRALEPRTAISHQLDNVERFTVLESVMMVDRHGLWYLEALSGAAPDKIRVPKGPLDNIDWDPALRNANRWFDRLSAFTRESDRAVREQRYKQLETDLKDMKTRLVTSKELAKALRGERIAPATRGELLGDLVLGQLIPAFWKMQQATDRSEQGQRNLHIAFALAAYQRDHKGYPKTLDGLAPKYLAKIPDDLFTGKPLVYRPSEKGYLLYSLGPDGKDDEGRGNSDDPKGDDIAVRIPVAKPMK
jgi:hypothetical protein